MRSKKTMPGEGGRGSEKPLREKGQPETEGIKIRISLQCRIKNNRLHPMELTAIKTGDIFYYEDKIPIMGKIHRYRCRVLFVGAENIFYDVWWDDQKRWSSVPVSKRLTYYRFPLNQLHRLTFDGFAPIDKQSADKLFLNSPEILLSITKKEIAAIQNANTTIEASSNTIAFVPTGPKGGELKPVRFDSDPLTKYGLVKMILEHQNLNFIQSENIVLHRIGLLYGIPSYCIKTG